MPATTTQRLDQGVSDHPISPLTLQFLTWLALQPRSYAETMEAWRTSCPRLTIWEDALGDGLVEVEAGRVVLTDRGRGLLDQA